MAGLLDFEDPQSAGLMALAAGLLGASGPSRMPVSFGQAFGQGSMQALDAMRQAREAQDVRKHRERQARMEDMRMQQMQAQMAEEQRKREALMRFRGTMPESAHDLFDVAPDAVIKSMIKEPASPQLVTVETPNGRMQRWVRPGEATGVDVGAPADKEAALPWYARRDPTGKTYIDPAFAELEKTKASFGRPPAQPMAPVAYVNDQGQTVWGTINEARGRPAANYNPSVMAAVAGAKEAATTKAGAEAKREITMQGLPDIISEARNILSGKAGAKPTSSMLGAAADVAGSAVGVSTEGANNAAKMKAIGGALIMKMPRMEGPQSNLDQQLYREQAGDVGNPMLPLGRRLAALEAIEKLNSKYAKPKQSPAGGAKFLGFE